MAKTHIALIGIRASGKTTIGKLLAPKINATFVDVDQELIQEAQVKNMLGAIKSKGKQWLAETENNLLKKLLSSHQKIVLATGGRTFSHEFPEIKKKNIALVRQHATTVLPLATEEELWDRIVKDHYTQHAHLDAHKLRQNFTESLQFFELYTNAADIKVKTDGKTPEAVAFKIAQLLAQ